MSTCQFLSVKVNLVFFHVSNSVWNIKISPISLQSFLLMDHPSRLYTIILSDLPASNGIIHIIDQPITDTPGYRTPPDEQVTWLTCWTKFSKDALSDFLFDLISFSSLWTRQSVRFWGWMENSTASCLWLTWVFKKLLEQKSGLSLWTSVESRDRSDSWMSSEAQTSNLRPTGQNWPTTSFYVVPLMLKEVHKINCYFIAYFKFTIFQKKICQEICHFAKVNTL